MRTGAGQVSLGFKGVVICLFALLLRPAQVHMCYSPMVHADKFLASVEQSQAAAAAGQGSTHRKGYYKSADKCMNECIDSYNVIEVCVRGAVGALQLSHFLATGAPLPPRYSVCICSVERIRFNRATAISQTTHAHVCTIGAC